MFILSDLSAELILKILRHLEQHLSMASERSERALGSGENSRCMFPIDSEMAGSIKLNLGGMVEGMGENVLAKEFF